MKLLSLHALYIKIQFNFNDANFLTNTIICLIWETKIAWIIDLTTCMWITIVHSQQKQTPTHPRSSRCWQETWSVVCIMMCILILKEYDYEITVIQTTNKPIIIVWCMSCYNISFVMFTKMKNNKKRSEARLTLNMW